MRELGPDVVFVVRLTRFKGDSNPNDKYNLLERAL